MKHKYITRKKIKSPGGYLLRRKRMRKKKQKFIDNFWNLLEENNKKCQP